MLHCSVAIYQLVQSVRRLLSQPPEDGIIRLYNPLLEKLDFLVRRCVSGAGEAEGDELCPNAVCAHDPALIPEQAHGNMAACTTTEWREEGNSAFGFSRYFPALPLTD